MKSDENQMKICKKYSYLRYWIRDDQRFEIRKNLWCKFFISYFQQSEWYLEEINGNKYLAIVPTNGSKEKIKKYEEMMVSYI